MITTDKGFLLLESPSNCDYSIVGLSPILKVTFFFVLLTGGRSEMRGVYAEMFLISLGFALRTLFLNFLFLKVEVGGGVTY